MQFYYLEGKQPPSLEPGQADAKIDIYFDE